jgi:hypothetical protein
VNSPKYESEILNTHSPHPITWSRDLVDPSDLPDIWAFPSRRDPTISVSGAVVRARIASATSPSSRERGTYPAHCAGRRPGEQEQRRSTESEDREAKRRFVARWVMASSSPTAMPISASTISISVHVAHHPTPPASAAFSATSIPIAWVRWK